MIIEYQFDTPAKYKFIDKMLKELTKRELMSFYAEVIQPKLKRINEVYEEGYELYRVQFRSSTIDGKTTYSVRFYDTGSDDCLITFSLFKFTGECYYMEIINQISSDWQKFLIEKLGNSYKILIAQHTKHGLDKEQKKIDDELEQLEARQQDLRKRIKLYENKYDDVIFANPLVEDVGNVD